MMETTVNTLTATQETALPKQQKKTKSRTGLYGYLLLFATMCGGLLLRNEKLVNPQDGLGYWLGIVGGSLMLVLLLYPAGKRSTIMQRMGLVKHWFRIHMIFGLLGPLLILYHCNFSVSAMNSKVALYSMLAVSFSGLIGRYFYTRIHRGLYGKRAGIEELRSEIDDAMSNSRGLAAILPEFINQLHVVSADLMGNEFTRAISIRRSLLWIVKYYVVRVRLYLTIRRELRNRAMGSDAVRTNTVNLEKTANAYATQQVRLMRQVAQLSLFERLFSLWHVFHMPLFILLVISALVHVLAVHMY